MKNNAFFLLLLLLAFSCKQTDSSTPHDNASPPPGEGRDGDVENTQGLPDASVVVAVSQDKIPVGFRELTWKQLADVQYEVQYFEAAGDSLLFPSFGPQVLAARNQKVFISGYVIPVSYDRYVLSANPFSSCFFCGNAGPESVMELGLTSYEEEMFFTDEFRTFTGQLELNDADIDKLNYILKDAFAVD